MVLPIVMGPEGRVNTSPEVLRANLDAGVAAKSPGYTSRLPGSLIEDVASTDTGALVVQDQNLTDQINSLTPRGANLFLLNQQRACAGIAAQTITNTSVFVIFTGPAGWTIQKGFTVSDGAHQYVVQDGAVIGGGATSSPVYCLATVAGAFAVPANTVTTLSTSVPNTITLSVNNPNAGTPSAGEQSTASLQAQVLQAYGRSSAQGMATELKTLLGNVTGVQQRLISIQQGDPSGWKVVVGGGDPYEVADAIYKALFDISTLIGSTEPTRNIAVTLISYPDTYLVRYVAPFAQQVKVGLLWDTISPNIVSSAAASQVGQPAIAAYVNSVAAGQPLNLFELQNAFQIAMAPIVPVELLTRMVFEVKIDNVVVNPDAGTGIIPGDPEGFFQTSDDLITVQRG